jgi:hypothetical protein
MLDLVKPYLGPVALFALERALDASPLGVSPFFSGAILSFALFWFLLALVSHKALVKRFPKIREWLPFVDPTGAMRALPTDLTAPYLRGHTFAINDVARGAAIENRTFEECTIYGPGVIALADISSVTRCDFAGTPDAVIVRVTQPMVIGPVIARNCTFTRCKFRGIGFIGPPDLLAKFTEKQSPKLNMPD